MFINFEKRFLFWWTYFLDIHFPPPSRPCYSFIYLSLDNAVYICTHNTHTQHTHCGRKNNNNQTAVVVTDVVLPSDSSIRKEHEKLKNYQDLKGKFERTWKVKAKVVPVMVGTLRPVTSKLWKWLQQIPRRTLEISVQKSAVLGTVKILHKTLKFPGPWQRIWDWGRHIPSIVGRRALFF